MPRLAVPIAVLALGLAVPAHASDHRMLVDELFPSAATSEQFVELRDPVAEPFPFPPYTLTVHDGAGALMEQQSVSPIPNSTQPFLVGRSTPRDAELTVTLPTGTGQVCFRQGGASGRLINCLGYGTVTAPVGNADVAPSPPPGKSVQRTATGVGCGAPTRDAPNAVSSCSALPGPGPSPGPGSGPGPSPQPGKPVVKLAAARRQDVDRLAVIVRLNEAATVRVRATFKVGRRSFSKRSTKSVAADQRTRFRLRFSRRAKRAAKRALRSGRRVTARITVRARDRTGDVTVVKRNVRLRP